MYRIKKRLHGWMAAVAVALCLATSALAGRPAKYATYDLHPGSNYLESYAFGISDAGTAVGRAKDQHGSHAMCWSVVDGKVFSEPLDEGDAYFATTCAFAVDAAGRVAGGGTFDVTVPYADGGTCNWPLAQGVFWSSSSATPVRLEPPSGYHECWALGMNDQGVIVGVAYQQVVVTTFDEQLNEYVDSAWRVGRTGVAWRVVEGQVSDVKALGPLPDDGGSVACAVNNPANSVCLVVGFSQLGSVEEVIPTAAMWAVTMEHDGTLSVSDPVETATPGGNPPSFACGVNDVPQACGVAMGNDGSYIGYAGGQPLDALRKTHCDRESVQDLNLAGDAVGSLITNTGYHRNAVIWTGGTPTLLEKLMGPSSFSDLWDACKINTHGDIVGYGIDSLGEWHAFVMFKS